MPHLTTKPLAYFKPDAKQARQHYDEADDRRLGESMMAQGQIQPVGAKPDGTLLWGHRRLRAAILVGLKELQVIITEKPLTDTEIRLIQLTENMHRADLTGHEKWRAGAELMCMNPHWQMKDLAEALKLDPSMTTRLLSPSKCLAAVQEALAAGKIGISDCYAISKLPEREQAGLLAMKLSGASRDAIEQAGRNSRNGKPDGDAPPRVPKIKIPLATTSEGVPVNGTVTVAGVAEQEIDLQGAEIILKEAMKAIKEAQKKGWTVKSAMSAWKDTAAVCKAKAKRGVKP